MNNIRTTPASYVMIVFATIIFGCGERSNENSVDAARHAHEPHINRVQTLVLEKAPFREEIVSNGKLKAQRKSELRFRVVGELRQLSQQNGNTIREGETIAMLDQFEYRQRLDQARTALKNASIELQDMLLGHSGYKGRTDSMAQTVYETVALRSGYIAAERELKTAQFNLEGTVLRAPFRGKIANIHHRVYEQVGSTEVFCVVIDDAAFDVEFQLMESEVGEVSLQDKVKVVPYTREKGFSGYICEINPFVDENGLVLVKARIRNDGTLWEGMNVKVLIEKELPNQLVVPRSAVVLRQNQEVLFKYVGGRAYWTYVQTGQGNTTSLTVTAHPEKGGTLQAGDTIIISDNLNLAHKSVVERKE